MSEIDETPQEKWARESNDAMRAVERDRRGLNWCELMDENPNDYVDDSLYDSALGEGRN